MKNQRVHIPMIRFICTGPSVKVNHELVVWRLKSSLFIFSIYYVFYSKYVVSVEAIEDHIVDATTRFQG